MAHAARIATPPGRLVPPGPPPLRRGLVGKLGYYWNFITDPIGFVTGRFDAYGDIYYTETPTGGLYVIKHPDHIRDVLMTGASSFRKTHTGFHRLSDVLGDGLLTTDGDVWRRQRRIIQPAFHKSRLRVYADLMTDEIERHTRSWRDGQTEDVSVRMMELTLRVVSRALFGRDMDRDTGTVARAMTALQHSLVRPDLLPRWVPTPLRRTLNSSTAALDRMVYGVIEDRRRRIRDSDAGGVEDLLQMLVLATDPDSETDRLSDREVRDQLVTFYLAGHETTSNALTWTWYLLSQHPDIEGALHEQLDRVLDGRSPTLDDLDALPLVEKILKEAMRLYPPVYVVIRAAHEPAHIGEYPVAPGSEVVIWTYLTHRDPRWYPSPEAFRPERFAPEREAELPKLAYLPFGGGPRACIGKAFAMIEAKLILAALAQRFRLRLVPGHRVQVRPRITLLPRRGMKMTIHARRRYNRR